jgi:drug/metabolite transporter (DMT)-like permease
LVVLQALSQIYASYFTNAYLAQLIFMLCPLFTAVANKVLLRQPAPAQLWPTIIFAVAGSGMVIAGSWISNGNTTSTFGSKTLSPQVSLIVGVSLALTSTLLLSSYLVLLQVTRHIVTGEQVLWAKRNVAAVVLVPLALAVNGTDWGWVRALTTFDWLVLVFTGIFIYTLANIWLQFCSRNLGAATVSVFISLRLVASILGSIVLLREVPRHVLTWVGFAVVVLVMTAFLLLQHKKKQHNARDANHNVLSVVVTSSSEGNGSVTAVNIAPAAAAASVTSISESLNDGISSASSSNKLLKATAGKSSHGTDIV